MADLACNSADDYLLIKRNKKMSAAWLFGCFLIGVCFGAFPWIVMGVNGQLMDRFDTNWQGLLFASLFSLFSCSFAGWLFFHALCSIELVANDDGLEIARKLGLIRRDKQYTPVQCIYLVYRWRNQKTGPKLTLTVRCGRKKKTILSELEASDLDTVYQWLAKSTSIKLLNLRDHPALD